MYQELDADARLAQYRGRKAGQCWNGTVLATLRVSGQGQCCDACTARAGCAGWTLRHAEGGTCELMQAPLTNQAPDNATCLSGMLDNTTSSVGLQTLNSVALQIGAMPSVPTAWAIADAIAHDAIVTHDAHVTTGLMGTKYILPSLSHHGHGEAALRLVNQTTMPSWGAMVHGPLLSDMAGTQPKPGTIWEEYGSAGSVNHPALTSFEPWFYSTLAGIRPTGPGFAESAVAPQLLGNLTSVDAMIDTVAGPLRCSWVRTQTNLSIDVTIPPNTESTVTIPTGDASRATVTEGGAVVWLRGVFRAGASAGVASGWASHGAQQPGISFVVGSGRYAFVADAPELGRSSSVSALPDSAVLSIGHPRFGTASAGSARMPGLS
eukprot:COSAG04_NODE_6215_length_1382_cov_1.440374_1_plen_378_part_00